MLIAELELFENLGSRHCRDSRLGPVSCLYRVSDTGTGEMARENTSYAAAMTDSHFFAETEVDRALNFLRVIP